jgi:hypothetical protein
MKRPNYGMVAIGVGLFWGICAWAGLPYFGSEASRVAFFTLAILGAALSALSGARSWHGGFPTAAAEKIGRIDHRHFLDR